MKKLLLLIIIFTFGVVSAQDYEETSYGEDSYGSGEDSYGDSGSSYGEEKKSDNNDATSLLGEEPIQNYEEESPVNEKKPAENPKNPNVPGEVHKWQLAISTGFVHVNHCETIKLTDTTFGIPFDQTGLTAGYQLTSQIWIMAKFHLYANFVNGNGQAEFLLGPGIRADFIRTDQISFFGGAFLSIGSKGKIFLFSPEIYAGVEYNLNKYLAIGVISEFAYILGANKGAIHSIDFMLGPQLTVYF